MSKFVGEPLAIGQADFISSATQMHPLGTGAVGQGGRRFRYAKAGASALVAGNALQSAVVIAGHDTCTVATHAIGTTVLTVTPGTTAVTANQYADGFLITDTTVAEGYTYHISSNTAAAINGAIYVTIDDPLGLIVATVTASSKVTLTKNPFSGVVQAASTVTGAPVGVATYIIGANEYGWIGTGGLHGTLITGTPAIGNSLVVTGTAGALAIASGTLPTCGYALKVGVSGLICPVMWTLD
jgi:hypothetical protein